MQRPIAVPPFPTPAPASSKADVRAFFDGLATNNGERHGPPKRLLHHRLEVLDRHARFADTDVVLDVGCGDGQHLHALADWIHRGIGIDLSPKMIAAARKRSTPDSIGFRVGDAERLESVPTSSIDKVICVGVLEHVLHPLCALRQMARVLKPTGRFVVLTLNGAYWWYRLADRLGLPSRHLTTDQRFDPSRARRMLRLCGLSPSVGFWRFIPAGDLPAPVPALCRVLDTLGERTGVESLRGGLRLSGHPRPRAFQSNEADGIARWNSGDTFSREPSPATPVQE